MFEQKPGGVEDIFEDAAGPGASANNAVGTPAGAPPPLPIESNGGMLSGKIVWAALGGIVLLVLVGGGLYLALRGGVKAPAGEQTASPAPSAPIAPAVPEVAPTLPTQESTGQTAGVGTPVTASPGVGATASVIDTDRDGLSDSDEAVYGTDLKNPDTDGDGLSDYDEIRVYHTNPLSPDTDKDGYADGVEVKGGYDPNGPGKLTDINKALKK